MNYDEIISVATTLMLISGIIAMCVSLFTEFFLKKLFTMKTKTINAIVAVISIVATVICCVVYVQIKSIAVTWYGWLGFVMMGFLTACIAMNGYDKIFSYVFSWIRGMFGKGESNGK